VAPSAGGAIRLPVRLSWWILRRSLFLGFPEAVPFPRPVFLTNLFNSFTMAAANDLRKGMCIRYNGNAAIVLEVMHRTPGNLRAFVQAIIRYIGTGKSADVRFGSTDKVETVEVHRQTLEFSYKDRTTYHFMDPENYESVTFEEDFIGAAKEYLTENLKVEVLFVEGKPATLELPASVSLRVTESAEGVRGDSANNVQKPATLETGKIVTVPLFIKEGELVKIDTRTGDYMGRA
jgi:elongation factor P